MPKHPLLAGPFALLIAGLACGADSPSLPAAGSLMGLGVNIHFTDARAGELEQLAAGGYRIARMDFGWDGMEQQQGLYDFSAYDRLTAALERQHIRPYYILDYHNRFYDQGESPHSDAGRDAFCAWVAAALKHFAGHNIIWEMYNEPNIGFWKPRPKVEDYAKLCLAVGATIRAIAPHEIFVGPAVSEIDLHFLEQCFAAGCLRYWDAVSVHPYRHRPPETAAADYRIVREMIARYAPSRPDGTPTPIPLIAGEWGYSSGGWGEGYDEALQGRYLPRLWLTNLANDIRISIWYDWHEDGTDAKEGEHHFGSVRFPYLDGHPEVYQPKPAYLAARTLTSTLRSLPFSKALALGPDEHVLLFGTDAEQRLVAWSSAAAASTVTIPASAGRFAVLGHLGEPLPAIDADRTGLHLLLSAQPVYLIPDQPNQSLRLAVAWQRLPLDLPVEAPGEAVATAAFTNPLDRPLQVSFGGAATTVAPAAAASARIAVAVGERQASVAIAHLDIDGAAVWTQSTQVLIRNPLEASLAAVLSSAAGSELDIQLENPSGRPFQGTLALTDVAGVQLGASTISVTLAADQRQALLRLPLAADPGADYLAGIMVRDLSGASWRTVPLHRCHRLATFDAGAASGPAAWKALPDGDPKVGATWSLGSITAAPSSGIACGALSLTYHLEKGWKFLRLVGADAATLPGSPTAIGMWVHADGSDNVICLRLTDASGQTFQCRGGRLHDSAWHWTIFPLEAASGAFWGGAKDGVVHYPVRLDTLLIVDHGNPSEPSSGMIEICAPTLIE